MTDFVTFTKRTNYPKLGYLIHLLDEREIDSRLDGHSWHAPILKVRRGDLDSACALLDPIDNIPDNDPRFSGYENTIPTTETRLAAENQGN